jgi:hypothetical protein
MLETLAVIGGLVVLALVFRISGIRSVEWRGFKIETNEKPPKQLNK